VNSFGKWILNLTVGAIAFVFFLIVLFPLESIIRQGIARWEAANKGAYHVEIKSISPSIFFKTTFSDVNITQTGPAGKKALAHLKEVKLGIHYFALLASRIEASFEVKGSKGSMEGSIALATDGYKLDADLEEFALDDIPGLGSKLGITLKGTADGSVDLEIDNSKVNKDNGNINLKLKNLVIPASRVTPMSGLDIDLPDLTLVDEKGGSIRVVIEDGKVDMKEFKLPGPDLSLNLKGKIQLNNKMDLSRVTLDGDFNYSEKLQTAFPLVVVIEKEKNEAGVYPLSISGRFSKPKIKIGSKDIL